jgi:Tol biopolymer transport system component
MMIAATRVLCACLLAVLNVAASEASRKLTEFPGTQAQLRSPDGRYVVENVDSDKEPHHTLLLKNRETGAVRTLCNYPRHVTVLWSPDGKKLAVNDYAGGDFSKILIFSADQDSPPQDVGADLLQSLKDPLTEEALPTITMCTLLFPVGREMTPSS